MGTVHVLKAPIRRPAIAALADASKIDDLGDLLMASPKQLHGTEIYVGWRTAAALMERDPERAAGPTWHDAGAECYRVVERILDRDIDAVIALRDPAVTRPHSSDLHTIVHLCDVHDVPLAMNCTSAEILLRHVGRLTRTLRCSSSHPSAYPPQSFPWDPPERRIPEQETP